MKIVVTSSSLDFWIGVVNKRIEFLEDKIDCLTGIRGWDVDVSMIERISGTHQRRLNFLEAGIYDCQRGIKQLRKILNVLGSKELHEYGMEVIFDEGELRQLGWVNGGVTLIDESELDFELVRVEVERMYRR